MLALRMYRLIFEFSAAVLLENLPVTKQNRNRQISKFIVKALDLREERGAGISQRRGPLGRRIHYMVGYGLGAEVP